ncbi:MAG: hypothetical protein NVSMB27_38630 [Ktedonobacteraceae bacterium]
MSGEEQERFEDYLELEKYIEQLQAGHVAHPPAEMTPSQASIYRMAALFRSATPEASEPRPEFAAELQARLEEELQRPPQKEPAPTPLPRKRFQKFRGVSRRALLAGSAAAAASLVVGAGVGASVERGVELATNGTPPSPYSETLIGAGVATDWLRVIPLAQLGESAVRFETEAIVGYVVRNDGDQGEPDASKEPVIAMSAACTHMGCIVQWQDSDRKYHCPCHGGLFTEYGKVDNGAWGVPYLYALPRLNTKIIDGHVCVEVPTKKPTKKLVEKPAKNL